MKAQRSPADSAGKEWRGKRGFKHTGHPSLSLRWSDHRMRGRGVANTAARAWSLRHLSTQAEAPHWLDHWFPALRSRLDRAAHKAWLRNVTVLLERAAPGAMQQQQRVVADAVQHRYRELLSRHTVRVPATDAVAQGHVRAACRVAATYAAVLPFARNSETLLELVKEQAGMAAAPALRAARVSAWLFAPDPQALALRVVQHHLRTDYGTQGFEYEHVPDGLLISKCLYNSIFTEEGVPGLAQCTCCSLDTRAWFGSQRKSMVLAALRPSAAAVHVCLETSRARGDSTCCIRVMRIN